MDSLWPWLTVAGLGALHGLNPTTGWIFAAAWGMGGRDRGGVWRALLPIAIGHVASIAVVAFVVGRGAALDRGLFQIMAGGLLVAAALYCRGGGTRHRVPGREAGHAGIALWSFLMASAHGAGLMLLPALVPMCLAGTAARATSVAGSLVPALAAVAVHTAAMLLTTGIIASGVCRGLALRPRRSGGAALRRAGPAVLAITGVLLIVARG